MIENLTFDKTKLWNEIIERGRAEAVTTQESFDSLVDEILTEHLDVGEMSPDQNYDQILESFQGRWVEFQEQTGLL